MRLQVLARGDVLVSGGILEALRDGTAVIHHGIVEDSVVGAADVDDDTVVLDADGIDGTSTAHAGDDLRSPGSKSDALRGSRWDAVERVLRFDDRGRFVDAAAAAVLRRVSPRAGRPACSPDGVDVADDGGLREFADARPLLGRVAVVVDAAAADPGAQQLHGLDRQESVERSLPAVEKPGSDPRFERASDPFCRNPVEFQRLRSVSGAFPAVEPSLVAVRASPCVDRSSPDALRSP